MKTQYTVNKKRLIRYRWYEMEVDFNKEILKLPHSVEVYKKIDKEQYDLIEERADRKTKNGNYYQIKHRKYFDDEYKRDLVDEFLSRYDLFIQEQLNKKVSKTSAEFTQDKYTRLLDFLGSYLMGYTESKYDKEKYSYRDDWEDTVNRNSYNAVGQVDDIEAPIKCTKKWKNSRTHRFNNLFTFDNKKNEIYIENWYDDKSERIYLSDHHIKLERDFDRSDETFKSSWEFVDVDGNFCFDNKTYSVNQLDQYKKREFGYDIYRNEYDMDRVLCIKQASTIKFYDENIYEIKVKEC